MSWQGEVISINIAPSGSAPTHAVNEVRAVAGRGLEGDRYFLGTGSYSNPERARPDREVTLIEIEAIEALERDYRVKVEPGASRRNIVTRGVPLNHLVGRDFKVGAVVLRGIRLCEPCEHLEELAGSNKLREGLAHRGGLRAQIVAGGTIRVGESAGPA